MSRYRREYIKGGTYFFTVVTAHRWPMFARKREILLLRNVFRAVRRDWPFRLDAIVILPDHLHAIMKLPPGDSDFSTRWRLIKARFSRSLMQPRVLGRSQRRRGEKGIWQRRFWEHVIRDPEDLRRHVDYIHYNPVKHGYVMRPADWPWGSFRQYVAKGRYPEDWAASVEPPGIRRMNPE